jgi:hypothetical protein
MNYNDFIERKTQFGSMSGFKPISMPNFLFDFQKALVEWSLQKGRAAIFADCGLGKGQPVGSVVLTLNGWKEIQALTKKDRIFASDGLAYNVTGIYHKKEQDTFRVHFSDGCSFVVDADHLHIVRIIIMWKFTLWKKPKK